MKTVPEMLRWRARLDPDGTALVFGTRTTTYRELDLRANRVAQALMTAGVRPGQRVCVLDKGHDEFFEVIFGIAKAGGVYTPVNWRLAPPEIAFVLNDAEAPLVFVGAEFAEAVAGIEDTLTTVRSVVYWGSGKKHWTDYESFRNGGDGGDPRADGDVDATAWQLYTSGTTGHPKGAELTHANLCDAVSLGAVGFGAGRPGDVALVCMPLYHIGGSGYALALFYSGATLVIIREPDPGTILSCIETERITHAFLVPALMNFLLQHPACRTTDFSSLRSLLYGASPIPGDLLAACIETFGCELIQAYGLTETTGAVVLLPPQEHVPGNPRLRACGLPVYGTDLMIARADGSACGAGEVGEILIRGPMVMKGYYNRPAATAEVLRGGWFHSGDAGYRDEDGYVYIHDRVKDMIVSGGENVYPAEVESILFAHPEVADVAVIGVPDDRWGETVKAVVVRTAGSQVSEADLIDYCRGKIAGFKRPRSIDFVDVLPRNPTGKILKRALREPYWSGRDRRVN